MRSGTPITNDDQQSSAAYNTTCNWHVMRFVETEMHIMLCSGDSQNVFHPQSFLRTQNLGFTILFHLYIHDLDNTTASVPTIKFETAHARYQLQLLVTMSAQERSLILVLGIYLLMSRVHTCSLHRQVYQLLVRRSLQTSMRVWALKDWTRRRLIKQLWVKIVYTVGGGIMCPSKVQHSLKLSSTRIQICWTIQQLHILCSSTSSSQYPANVSEIELCFNLWWKDLPDDGMAWLERYRIMLKPIPKKHFWNLWTSLSRMVGS